MSSVTRRREPGFVVIPSQVATPKDILGLLGGNRVRPVAGDGKVFVVDTEGRLTVLKAGREWKELSSISLGEPCFATPAICQGRVYVRTSQGLYCFGRPSRENL